MSYYYGFPQYVSVGEKRAKAERKLKQLKKKNPGIQPIVLEGSAIAKTWWGKEWNKNLERYADYSNRIGRGRSYIRHGAVLDLKIKPGQVEALVQGSRSNPYSVFISIEPIPKKNWDAIKQSCRYRGCYFYLFRPSSMQACRRSFINKNAAFSCGFV